MRTLRGPMGVGLAVALVFAGCGGDDDGGGDKQVSAADFADGLCGALGEFAGSIKKSVDDGGVGELLSGDFKAETISDLPKVITAMTKTFDDIDEDFASLRDDLAAIGTPEVKGGAKFRERLLTAIDKGADYIGETATKLEDTNPDSLADLGELGTVLEGFEKAFAEVNIDIDTEAPKEVSAAKQESKTCKEAEEKYGEF